MPPLYVIQELEKRYYTHAGGESAKTAKAAAADLALLSGFFSQRGWVTLTVPSSNSSSGCTSTAGLTEADYRELDAQLDEVSVTHIQGIQCCHAAGERCPAPAVVVEAINELLQRPVLPAGGIVHACRVG